MKPLIGLLSPGTGIGLTTVTLGNAVWQGLLLTALIWGVLQVFRRLNAASRFAIWWLTLLAVVCLPLAQGAWRVGSDWASAAKIQSARAAVVKARQAGPQAEAQAVAELEACLDGKSLAAAPPSLTRWFFPVSAGALPARWVAWFTIAWALGAVVMSLRLVWGLFGLWRVKRQGAPLPASFQENFTRYAVGRLGRRQARLYSSEAVASPMAIGFLKPVVMLPEDLASRLSGDEFKHVCLHELAHLQRGDDWTNLAQQIIRAVLWFHPAVIWISRQLALEREVACDDLVIGATEQVKPYALCLTRLAELVRVSSQFELAPGASLTRTQLSRRINLLLDRTRDTSPRLARGKILATLALLFAGLILSVNLAPSARADARERTATISGPATASSTPASTGTSNPDQKNPPTLPAEHPKEVKVVELAQNPPVIPPPIAPAPQPVVSPTPTPGHELLVWDSVIKEQTVKPGASKADFIFWVTNVSDVPVTIEGIHPSCGCTVAKAPPMPWTLAPHSDGKVDVSVDLAGKSGTLLKQLTVISSNAPQVLNVRITIPADTDESRARNMQMAAADPQAIFKNDCAKCHVEPAKGKIGIDLYTAACGVCHEAAHRATMVPDLRGLPHPTDYAFWKDMIKNGKPNTLMPGFSVAKGGPLTDEQVESLAQLLTKGVPKPVVLPPPTFSK